MAISNIGVQIYEHVFATQFRDTPRSQALIARRWDLLSPQAFLCTLGHAPEAIRGGLKRIGRDGAFPDIGDSHI